MLNEVPKAIMRAARLVTLNHPNAMDGTAHRKRLNRVAPGNDTMGGNPTVGGMGLLDGEDEADFTYELLGDVKVVFAGVFQGEGNNWLDSDDGINYPQMPIEAIIECTLDPEHDDYFTVEKPDYIAVEPGGGSVLIYEVVGVTGTVNVPPYTRKYILAARSDSDVGI